MKTLVTSVAFLILSLSVKAQIIDTVLVRSGITLQAGDWAWMVGHLPDVNQDSVTAVQFRRIRDKIRIANPALWTTNVTIDSLPGKVVLAMYQTVKLATAGEIAARYAAITGAISAKANMTFFINQVDAAILNDYTKRRDRGKYMLMDN
jgi:hypothetical protein